MSSHSPIAILTLASSNLRPRADTGSGAIPQLLGGLKAKHGPLAANAPGLSQDFCLQAPVPSLFSCHAWDYDQPTSRDFVEEWQGTRKQIYRAIIIALRILTRSSFTASMACYQAKLLGSRVLVTSLTISQTQSS